MLPSPVDSSEQGLSTHLSIITASRTWELGATAEDMLKLRNPELTMFANHPFSWRAHANLAKRTLSQPRQYLCQSETPLAETGDFITHCVIRLRSVDS